MNQRMGGDNLSHDQQLLIELLAGFDRPVNWIEIVAAGWWRSRESAKPESRTSAREVNERKTPPFAHVEQEDLHRPGRGPAGLQHQLGRLRNGHEVAGDLGGSRLSGLAAGDLLPEKRHHRTGRPSTLPKRTIEQDRTRSGGGDPGPRQPEPSSSQARFAGPQSHGGAAHGFLSVESG